MPMIPWASAELRMPVVTIAIAVLMVSIRREALDHIRAPIKVPERVASRSRR